jgi:hypothetical protein
VSPLKTTLVLRHPWFLEGRVLEGRVEGVHRPLAWAELTLDPAPIKTAEDAPDTLGHHPTTLSDRVHTRRGVREVGGEHQEDGHLSPVEGGVVADGALEIKGIHDHLTR